MEHNTFSALAASLKVGDNTILTSIFEAHSSYCIKRLGSRHNCSREDAEDLYIDAILNFRDKVLAGKLTSVIDLKSYLYGTCENMFLTRLNQQKRVFNAAYEQYHFELGSSADNNEEISVDMLTWVNEGLSNLNEKCRDLLTSYYFTRLSMEEIAEKFNMASPGVAKVSKSRCLQRLVAFVKNIQQVTKANATR
jgi:RNA polymerase sigma factor (sigma-70 family)